MKPKEFKELKSKLREILRETLSNSYTDFVEVDLSTAKGQIFVFNLFYAEEYINELDKPIDRVNIVRPILYFQAEGFWKNETLDINAFYQIDDEIYEEFYEMCQRQELQKLIPVLQHGISYSSPVDIGQSIVSTLLFLSLDSFSQGGSELIKQLLHESIAVIGLDEKNNNEAIIVDCSQFEKKKITALIDDTPIKLEIPFDKIEIFDAFQTESEKLPIDEKYIFVAMAFQKLANLEDSYSAIQRAVRSLRKGLKCERVDEIQEDFTITDKIIGCINKAKVVIVDLTGNRPNVYYELGFARAIGKQIIVLCLEGETPHFDASHQNIIFYNSATNLENRLKTRLKMLYR